MILIHYKSRKLRKICEDAEVATKAYGLQMAEKLQQRIDEISSAGTVEELVQYRIGRCHSLTGKRKGQYAMDLTHPYRLVFSQEDDFTVSVRIEEIVDYH